MLAAAIRDGTVDTPCVFEVFARRLPEGRRYGVVAGVARVLDAIDEFGVDADELAWLRGIGAVDDATAAFVASYRFRGDDRRLPGRRGVLRRLADPDRPRDVRRRGAAGDVDPVDPEPRLVRRGRGGADGHRSAGPSRDRDGVATHARAGGDRSLACRVPRRVRVHVEPRSRSAVRHPHRWHGCARVHAAAPRRAVGVRRRRWPNPGRRPRCSSTPTTSPRGSSTPSPRRGRSSGRCGSIRAISACSRKAARLQLDSLGNRSTRIVVSGDLDEYAIAGLAASPVDVYGAGTAVVMGSGAPTAGLVYKLVEVDGRPVAKRSAHKATQGGGKIALRSHRPSGTAIEEIVVAGPSAARDREAARHRPRRSPACATSPRALWRDGAAGGGRVGDRSPSRESASPRRCAACRGRGCRCRSANRRSPHGSLPCGERRRRLSSGPATQSVY